MLTCLFLVFTMPSSLCRRGKDSCLVLNGVESCWIRIVSTSELLVLLHKKGADGETLHRLLHLQRERSPYE